MSVDLNMMFCACKCLFSVYPLESGNMLQPYIESVTVISDRKFYS